LSLPFANILSHDKAWERPVAKPRDELVKFWAVVVLVAVTAVSLCVAMWNALPSHETAAQPIRIELSSLPTSPGDEAVDFAGASGGGQPAEVYGLGDHGELPLTVATGQSAGLSQDLIGETDLASPRGQLVSSGSSGLPKMLEYDFASRSGSGQGSPGASAIYIRKALRINGVDSGYAHIRVSTSSSLSISTDELSKALAAAGRSDAATHIGYRSGPGEFIGLEDLRRQGIDVRFDARTDRILLYL
jgi:hypothetical protein